MSRTMLPFSLALTIPKSSVKSSKLSLMSDSLPASLSITARTVSAIVCVACSMALVAFSVFLSFSIFCTVVLRLVFV